MTNEPTAEDVPLQNVLLLLLITATVPSTRASSASGNLKFKTFPAGAVAVEGSGSDLPRSMVRT
jgi:hypothetical protein